MKRGARMLLLLLLSALPFRPLAQGAAPADSSKSHGDSALTVSSQAPKDSIPKPKTRADSVTVPKHTFNHRQQIITGGVVMSCLLLILLTMNNYNPR
jgi:hypothetical protein